MYCSLPGASASSREARKLPEVRTEPGTCCHAVRRSGSGTERAGRVADAAEWVNRSESR